LAPHASKRDLEEYVDGLLSDEDSSSLRTHLDGCAECQRRLAEFTPGVPEHDPERRTETRALVHFPGRLKLLDPVTSTGPPHQVEVIEISSGGLKIRTERSLIPKTLVQIRYEGKAVLGEVRYCIRVGAEYHAGIELKEEFPE